MMENVLRLREVRDQSAFCAYWNALKVREVRAQVESDAFWASMAGEVLDRPLRDPLGLE